MTNAEEGRSGENTEAKEGTKKRHRNLLHQNLRMQRKDDIFRRMHSDLEGPVNIGCPQNVSVEDLVVTLAEVAGKKVNIKYVEGPLGAQSRNFSNAHIYSTGWRAKFLLKKGIARILSWIEQQFIKARVHEQAEVGYSEVLE